MKIKLEVMLFTLETKSSKKLSSNKVLLSIDRRLKFLNEKHFVQKAIKLSLVFLKNREMTAKTRGVNTTMDINKMLAYARIPGMFPAHHDTLMQVPCSKNFVSSRPKKSFTEVL